MAHSAAPAAEHDPSSTNLSDIRSVADSLPDDFADFEDSRSSDHEEHARQEPELTPDERRAAEDLSLDEAEEAPEKARKARKADPAPDDAEEGEEAADEAPEREEGAEDEGEEAEQKAAEPEGKDAKPDRLNLRDDTTIVIDGHEVTGADVKRGFMRQADYTRKTTEVAQQRQQVEAQRQQIAAMEAELAQVLDLATEVTRGVLPKAPDIRQYNTQDPSALAQFLQDQQAYQEQIKGLETLVNARQSTTQQTEAQRRAAAQAEQEQRAQTEQQQLQNELRLLQERTPELRTREGWNKLHADVEKYGKDFGLTPQDVNSFRDHRMFPVLMAALEMQKLKAAKPATVKQAQAAPPIRPAARPASGTRASEPSRSAQDAFRRNPNARTAAASIPDDWIF